eukprot:TRINITY_DN14294_c0_g1_i1.p1 TRINITY_DN14294_c0_g1~~TRINITY_DN14294_c0_g1_i1.p1  ORF type:complete len:201 (-),score=51.68 TRINITY_DN14294_c0_g1_i1:668-1270(-)
MNIASLLCSEEPSIEPVASPPVLDSDTGPSSDVQQPNTQADDIASVQPVTSNPKRRIRTEASSSSSSATTAKQARKQAPKDESTIGEAVKQFAQDKELVSSIQKNLEDEGVDATYGMDASIYISAVLGYVSSQILTAAGNQSRQSNEERISPEHIQQAIETDHELSRFVKDVLIANGLGVDPTAYKVWATSGSGDPTAST